MNIPFLDFTAMNAAVDDAVRAAFARVWESKWYVLGKEVEAFEAEYAAFNETAHCVGIANGLEALHLSLVALGIGPGDEVIVPSNTYIATWLAVSYVGATPVPVEPRLETANLNPDLLDAALTDRTKAILPVHLYGQAAEMDAILAFANAHGLSVVADNAQAQGARYNGRLTGQFGNANATSFYPGKNLGALGDAGAITTDSPDKAHRLRVLRNYGSEKKYHNQVIGYNQRLDELQAAILRAKLPLLPQWNAERQAIAARYDDALADVPGVERLQLAPGAESVYHLYPIRVPVRDELAAYLREKDIGTLIHYPIPPHLQEAYQQLPYQAGDFPIAERWAAEELSLPIYPGLTEPQQEQVVEAIRTYSRSGTS